MLNNLFPRLVRFVLLTAAIVVVQPLIAWGQDEEDANPLGGVIADMQVAGGRLGRYLTDKPTQQKQQDAIDKLDVLIKLLEEQRRGGGQIGAKPSKPANESTIRQGPGGSGPLLAPRNNGRAWGELPAHKRDQIMQSMTEGFPPHYRVILEGYYRRLGDEATLGEAGDGSAAAPVSPPSSLEMRSSEPSSAETSSP